MINSFATYLLNSFMKIKSFTTHSIICVYFSDSQIMTCPTMSSYGIIYQFTLFLFLFPLLCFLFSVNSCQKIYQSFYMFQNLFLTILQVYFVVTYCISFDLQFFPLFFIVEYQTYVYAHGFVYYKTPH